MKKKKVDFLISIDLLEKLDKKAQDMGLKRTSLLIILINNFLKGENNNEIQ